MKIEKLNHSKFKYLLYTLILGVILIFIIGFETSKANYRTTQSINVANGKVSYSLSDLNVVAVYLQSGNDYVSSNDTVPTSGYVLNTTKTSCTKSGSTVNVTITYDSGTVSFTGLSKGVKCNLYFDIDPSKSVSDIVAGATAGSTSITAVSTTNEGIKSLSDGMYSGTTYYYRGAVNNNWVKFAGMYWRIIRFNGDRSIRMIYSGTTAPTSSTATVMTGTGTQTTTSYYNSSDYGAIYVGYYYTSNNGHGASTASTIADYLVGTGSGGWYSSSGLSSYASYIADGKFCNDRTTNGSYFSGYTSTTGYGTNSTAFAPATRVQTSSWGWNSTQTISTSCSNSSDIFTTKVGLITSDEVLMAGGKAGTSNSSYYLFTNQAYWTMSPHRYSAGMGCSSVFYIASSGLLSTDIVGDPENEDGIHGIRPVINLKAGTKFKGSGTYDNVYEIAS